MPTAEFIEIAVDDMQRAVGFYREMFGWQFEKMPGPMEYYTARTTDEKGRPGVVIGMMPRQHPDHRITPYVTVPSVEEAMAKARQVGGQVCMAKTPVPGMGWFAVCADSEGNGFAVWQDDSSAG